MKRIALFLVTNLMVGVLLFAVTSALGLQGWASSKGINYTMLMASSLLYGFVGAFISLGMSRIIAKWMMGVKLVSSQDGGPAGQVAREVSQLAQRAGLPVDPEVGIYESDEVNAFATGPSKRRSLVAVSTGMLNELSPEQIRAVLAHEIAHIKNGDMVTMTLIQGVVNSFAIFLARLVAYAVSNLVDSKIAGIVYFVVANLCNILFSILGSLVTMAFSRHREFRADAGASELVGSASMISALRALGSVHAPMDPNNGLATSKIAGSKVWLAPFSSHPPLEKRIEALQQLR